MLKVIFFIFFFLLNLEVDSEILFRVKVNYTRSVNSMYKDNHSIFDMYFFCKDIDSTIANLKSMSFYNENEFLNSLGTPIIEDYETSECISQNKLTLKSLFESSKTGIIKASNKDIRIEIEFVQAEFVTCTFNLDRKIWASINTSFKKAVVITNEITRIKKIQQPDKAKLKAIKRNINRLLETTVLSSVHR